MRHRRPARSTGTPPSPRPWHWSTWCDRSRQTAWRTVSFAFVRAAFVFPRGSHHAAVAPLLTQKTGERFRMAVRRNHTPGSSVRDSVEYGGPIGMIGQYEPAIAGTLPPDAAYPHQSRDEGVGDV